MSTRRKKAGLTQINKHLEPVFNAAIAERSLRAKGSFYSKRNARQQKMKPTISCCLIEAYLPFIVAINHLFSFEAHQMPIGITK